MIKQLHTDASQSKTAAAPAHPKQTSLDKRTLAKLRRLDEQEFKKQQKLLGGIGSSRKGPVFSPRSKTGAGVHRKSINTTSQRNSFLFN
mmetsp:Transcript_15917/g.26827  ORF Transcript_15917/g.26827 Transcript_15917/m.26827 type:complete len:89 (+) Transcript_15917:102-368(+)